MSGAGRDRAGRFRPGEPSGNPKGRPLRSRDVDTAITRALAEKVTVNEQGRRRRRTKLEVAAAQIANKSAGGDLAATRIALDQSRRAEERAAASRKHSPVLTSVDQEIITAIVARIRLCTPVEGEHDVPIDL